MYEIYTEYIYIFIDICIIVYIYICTILDEQDLGNDGQILTNVDPDIYIYLDSIYRYFDTYSFHCNMDPSQKCIPAYPPSPYPSFHINSPLNCHFGAQV